MIDAHLTRGQDPDASVTRRELAWLLDMMARNDGMLRDEELAESIERLQDGLTPFANSPSSTAEDKRPVGYEVVDSCGLCRYYVMLGDGSHAHHRCGYGMEPPLSQPDDLSEAYQLIDETAAGRAVGLNGKCHRFKTIR